MVRAPPSRRPARGVDATEQPERDRRQHEDDAEQQHGGRVALARLLELEQPLPDEPDERRGRLVRAALRQHVDRVEHLEVGDDRDHDREQQHRAQQRERDAPEARKPLAPSTFAASSSSSGTLCRLARK